MPRRGRNNARQIQTSLPLFVKKLFLVFKSEYNMDAVRSVATDSGLQIAKQELDVILSNEANDIQSIATAVEKCCAGIQNYFNSQENAAPFATVVEAMSCLKTAISCIGQRTTSAEDKLSALKLPVWEASLFPLLESCCFSDRYRFHPNSSS